MHELLHGREEALELSLGGTPWPPLWQHLAAMQSGPMAPLATGQLATGGRRETRAPLPHPLLPRLAPGHTGEKGESWNSSEAGKRYGCVKVPRKQKWLKIGSRAVNLQQPRREKAQAGVGTFKDPHQSAKEAKPLGRCETRPPAPGRKARRWGFCPGKAVKGVAAEGDSSAGVTRSLAPPSRSRAGGCSGALKGRTFKICKKEVTCLRSAENVGL